MSDPEQDADRPATFRGVLANGEYRAVFVAGALSSIGDSMARAAVTALVYQHTHSAFIAGATFAISYVPWIGFGPLLAALAERYPYKRTMVACDLAQMVAIGLIALLHLPVYATVGLMLARGHVQPAVHGRPVGHGGPDPARRPVRAEPVDHPDVHPGRADPRVPHRRHRGRFNPRLAVLFNAVTFAVSAAVVGLRVAPATRSPAGRPPPPAARDGRGVPGRVRQPGAPVDRHRDLRVADVPGRAGGFRRRLGGPAEPRPATTAAGRRGSSCARCRSASRSAAS